MKKTMISLSVLICTIFVISGCKSGPYQAKSDQYPLEQTDKVTIMDSKLESWIRVNTATKKYTDDGRLIAYAEIRNNHSKSVIVQVQTIFKDANNMALGDATNWESIIIPQNAVEYYQVPAFSVEAKEYSIRIKRGGFEKKIDR